jgi:hypothetical protein
MYALENNVLAHLPATLKGLGNKRSVTYTRFWGSAGYLPAGESNPAYTPGRVKDDTLTRPGYPKPLKRPEREI